MFSFIYFRIVIPPCRFQSVFLFINSCWNWPRQVQIWKSIPRLFLSSLVNLVLFSPMIISSFLSFSFYVSILFQSSIRVVKYLHLRVSGINWFWSSARLTSFSAFFLRNVGLVTYVRLSTLIQTSFEMGNNGKKLWP